MMLLPIVGKSIRTSLYYNQRGSFYVSSTNKLLLWITHTYMYRIYVHSKEYTY